MTDTRNITPAKFRCATGMCSSIHEHESGDFILIGSHVSAGELKNMNINAGRGEGAIRLSREFVDAWFMDHAARHLAKRMAQPPG